MNIIRKYINRSDYKRILLEKSSRIRIADYTTSKGSTTLALLVDNIPVMDVETDGMEEMLKRLRDIRSEYVAKRRKTE